jgi:hypothetical protein
LHFRYWLEAEATDKNTMSALPRITEAGRTAELGQLMTQSGPISPVNYTWVLSIPKQFILEMYAGLRNRAAELVTVFASQGWQST